MKKVYKGAVHRGVFFSKEILNTLIDFKTTNPTVFELAQSITLANSDIKRVSMIDPNHKPLVGAYVVNDVSSTSKCSLLGEGYWGLDTKTSDSSLELQSYLTTAFRVFDKFHYEFKVIILDLSAVETDVFYLDHLKSQCKERNIALIVFMEKSARLVDYEFN